VRPPLLHVALLRGVNVGGRRMIAMADLRAWLSAAGFADARSLLQSGNLVFGGGRLRGAALERSLEASAAADLGLQTDFIVRSGVTEWDGVVARNPFPEAAARDPSHAMVMFLKAAPPPDAVAALVAAHNGPESLAVSGREVYLVYPAGVGTSRLTGALIERKLGTRGTARNWNTVLKLRALVRGDSPG
jgi:uncharacterized protein (DUF1697 family)